MLDPRGDRAIAGRAGALRLRPDFANALDRRGFVHLQSGRYDHAIADYDAALRLDAKKPASLYGRGMAKRRKQDVAGGNADIAAARALKPEVSMDFARYGLSPPLPDMRAATCRRRCSFRSRAAASEFSARHISRRRGHG